MKKNQNKVTNRPTNIRQPAYPNAADDHYFAGKALVLLTAIVSGMGLVSAMLFLVTLA